MNPKYQKVCADIAKLEGKAADIQKQLNELYDKKTELENLEIINTVRAMVMDKDQVNVRFPLWTVSPSTETNPHSSAAK